MPVKRNLGRSARSSAASFNVLSQLPSSIGRTVGGIVEKREEEKKQAPIEALKQRLLTTQVESEEAKAKKTAADADLLQQVRDQLTNVDGTEEELDEVARQIVDSPIDNDLMVEAINTDSVSKGVSLLESSLKDQPDQAAPTGRAPTPAAQVTEPGGQLLGGINPRRKPPEEEPVAVVEETTVIEEPPTLQPGEQDVVEPKTGTHKIDRRDLGTKKPSSVVEAEKFFKVISKIPGAGDVPGLQKDIERHQKTLDKFEERTFAKEQQQRGFDQQTSEREAGQLFKSSEASKQKKDSLAAVEKLEKQNLFNNSDKLRKEFDNLSKTYGAVRDAFKRVRASSEDPSAAGDLALIFNYMKMLDPGSVVRESEFKTADQARAWLTKSEEGGVAVPSVVIQAIQKAGTGQRLLPAQRNDFVDRSNKLFVKQAETQQENIDRFTGLSEKFEIEPDLVVTPIDESLLVFETSQNKDKSSGGATKQRIVFDSTGKKVKEEKSSSGVTRRTFNTKTGKLE